jgi:hypothetical protein
VGRHKQMNKQKIIQDIEANKDKYGYYKGGFFWSLEGGSCCTLGLLLRANNMTYDSLHDMRKIYDMTDEERVWMVRQNDSRCDSFDCMIEAIKNYEQKK